MGTIAGFVKVFCRMKNFLVKGIVSIFVSNVLNYPETLQKRTDEKFVYNILSQKNISIKNINRLASISKKYSGELGEKAAILMKVAKLRPARKKRIGFLYHKHRELFDELVRLGFIEDYITPCVEADNDIERWLELHDRDHDVLNEIREVEYNQEYDDYLPF